jgi:hypothetical protein
MSTGGPGGARTARWVVGCVVALLVCVGLLGALRGGTEDGSDAATSVLAGAELPPGAGRERVTPTSVPATTAPSTTAPSTTGPLATTTTAPPTTAPPSTTATPPTTLAPPEPIRPVAPVAPPPTGPPPVPVAPTPAAPSTGAFRNCTEARTAGAAPVYRGQPGYGPHLDRDGDGVGCE